MKIQSLLFKKNLTIVAILISSITVNASELDSSINTNIGAGNDKGRSCPDIVSSQRVKSAKCKKCANNYIED